eukprot:s3648_g2.t1
MHSLFSSGIAPPMCPEGLSPISIVRNPTEECRAELLVKLERAWTGRDWTVSYGHTVDGGGPAGSGGGADAFAVSPNQLAGSWLVATWSPVASGCWGTWWILLFISFSLLVGLLGSDGLPLFGIDGAFLLLLSCLSVLLARSPMRQRAPGLRMPGTPVRAQMSKALRDWCMSKGDVFEGCPSRPYSALGLDEWAAELNHSRSASPRHLAEKRHSLVELRLRQAAKAKAQDAADEEFQRTICDGSPMRTLEDVALLLMKHGLYGAPHNARTSIQAAFDETGIHAIGLPGARLLPNFKVRGDATYRVIAKGDCSYNSVAVAVRHEFANRFSFFEDVGSNTRMWALVVPSCGEAFLWLTFYFPANDGAAWESEIKGSEADIALLFGKLCNDSSGPLSLLLTGDANLQPSSLGKGRDPKPQREVLWGQLLQKLSLTLHNPLHLGEAVSAVALPLRQRIAKSWKERRWHQCFEWVADVISLFMCVIESLVRDGWVLFAAVDRRSKKRRVGQYNDILWKTDSPDEVADMLRGCAKDESWPESCVKTCLRWLDPPPVLAPQHN